MKGFNSPNVNSNSFYNNFKAESESRQFREMLDKLVSATNIITGEHIFYHQIFADSTSGLISRYADIKAVTTIYVDKEPPEQLTNHGWRNIPRLINNIELDDIKLLFKALSNSNNAKLNLAARKLISSNYRKNSEDALLDTTIGLESLLSSDSKSEITYRLSLRGGLVCKRFPLDNFTPSQVRDFLKDIYSYRSAIVHGSKESSKKSKSQTELNGVKYDCNYLASKILRHCLRFFINNPRYINSDKGKEKNGGLKKLEIEILDN